MAHIVSQLDYGGVDVLIASFGSADVMLLAVVARKLADNFHLVHLCYVFLCSFGSISNGFCVTVMTPVYNRRDAILK